MKISKLLLIVFLISMFSCAFSQTKEYRINNFVDYQKLHKTIAIVPIGITIDPKSMPRDLFVDDLDRIHEEESVLLQDYFYITNLNENQKDKLSAELQDVRKTNLSLATNKITFFNILNFSKEDLAKFCAVDVIIAISFYKSSQNNNGKLRNSVDLKISIFDKSGLLLWEYYDSTTADSKKTHLSLEKELLDKIAKKLPYREKIK